MRIFQNLFAAFSLALLIASFASAAPVYKWEEKGIVHYSSNPPSPSAKPADLPPIMRAQVTAVASLPVSCDKHGGINCQAGADSDGSVICYDGFKESSPRFKFSCSSPKLEISDVSDSNPSGGFSVFVRNSKSVKADKPVVAFKAQDGREFKLTGPEEIAPFTIGEFVYQPKGQQVKVSEKPSMAQLDISCANCQQ